MDDDTEVIELDNSGNDSIVMDTVGASLTRKASYSQLPDDINMLDKDENEVLNKSLSTLFVSNSTSNSSSHSQEKTSTKSFDSTKNDTPDINLLDAPKISSIISDKNTTVDLPEGSLDCNDEFVNINLLDNPDFLKSVGNRSNGVSPIANMDTNESKTEDSDIEIVDIVESETASLKNDKDASDFTKEGSPELTKKTKIDIPCLETETKGQLSSDTESSNKSVETIVSSNNVAKKSDKPLTLEDIKDTGFSGTKLYKCGYEYCDYGAQNASHLRTHLKECPQRGENKNLNCAHCNKRFLKIGFLLEHLKVHGLKRFGCSLCKMRCTVGYQAIAHMKGKHRVATSKLVPADPKNPSVDSLFIVQPVVSIFFIYENKFFFIMANLLNIYLFYRLKVGIRKERNVRVQNL